MSCGARLDGGGLRRCSGCCALPFHTLDTSHVAFSLSLSLSLSLLRAAVVEDEEMGNILQLQGDQRDAVGKFLTENEIVEAKKIKKHGAG